ncbi:uncharacterized protein LOC123547875 [Mercenaria mercenaria]|uniref:uncharacterized protein LOC123547875 n=1 Tax=Mercenaria mercenaria TaxID=6596 RepID=UPI00234EF285|nr:uncharacterized protein LOC123547875 [Mercenaria mercenaria]
MESRKSRAKCTEHKQRPWNNVLFTKGIICVAILYFAHGSEAATTAWPEICRVMSLYRTCDDSTFRVACPYKCLGLESGCKANNLIYVPSKGKCYGITINGLNLWPFALDSCLWYNAKLAVLKDASDAEVIAALITETGNSETKFLVGALNVGKSSGWVHVDGTAVDDSFWSSGEPSSSSNLCMFSEKSKSYKQTSDNCGQNRAFVCEAF